MAKKEESKVALKKGQAKFMLIGEAKVNDFTFKIDEESKKSDWVYNQLNLGVDCGNGNVVYAEMMGGYGAERDNVIYVHGKKKNDNGKEVDDYESKFTIAWEDRFDEDILETIGEGCFLTVGLEKDTKDKVFAKKFLSQYDAIDYIKENLTSGMVVNVKGDLKYSKYNDNVQTKKEIKSVFLSKVDDITKYKATFTQTILIDKDSVGKLDKEKATYPIYATVIDYAKMYGEKEVKTNVPFAKTFEVEVNKEDPTKTKAFIEKVMKVKKDITEITVEGEIVEGATLVTITEDDIPEDIKELIECGAYTMEDAVAKLAVGGSREKRMILRRPVIQMVGEEDAKKPVILKTEAKYTADDLVLDFMLETSDEDEKPKTKTTTTKPKAEKVEKVEDEEDENAWLTLLDEDEA